ncbi:MAG TPA: hypothetical protein VHC90_20245 [Bryobacteraceae bacterium]|nr:hypothetical protein [Bryobacteraceae bacterium]
MTIRPISPGGIALFWRLVARCRGRDKEGSVSAAPKSKKGSVSGALRCVDRLLRPQGRRSYFFFFAAAFFFGAAFFLVAIVYSPNRNSRLQKNRVRDSYIESLKEKVKQKMQIPPIEPRRDSSALPLRFVVLSWSTPRIRAILIAAP